MSHCDACERDTQGIWFLIPSADWLAICGEDKYLCLRCTSERLHAIGRRVRVEITVDLPGIKGSNMTVLQHMEIIDAYLPKMEALKNG